MTTYQHQRGSFGRELAKNGAKNSNLNPGKCTQVIQCVHTLTHTHYKFEVSQIKITNYF